MISKEELTKELIRECAGYRTTDIKPDGAYIEGGARWDNGRRRLFNLNKIKHLIERGANVNTRDMFAAGNDTLLHIALQKERFGLAQVLLTNGADVNAGNLFGETPLHWAVKEEYCTTITQILLANGADVNAKNSFQQTPLHWAAEWGRTEHAELLLANGAELNAKDKRGRTPYDLTSTWNRKLRDLLKK